MSFRCWVVDDEKAAHKGLKLALEPFDDFTICGNYYAVEQLPDVPPDDVDIVFLDIEMPRAEGFTLFERWQQNLPIIVFVTAYNQHALQAFEHQAFDYVLKPIDSERFVKLVERLRLRLNEKSFYANRVQLEQVVNSVKKSTSLISVPTDEGVFQVQLGDILYLQAVGDFVAITLSDKALITRSTTKAMVEKLASDRFIQIHRSYFVNIDAIEKFEKTRFGDGLLHMSNQQKLKVSRKYKNTLLAELNN